ncbi:MAG: SpoIIE family protein phosphatase [Bacteroidetes bacterium]|nr:SpoIIE family protein phosphatase [Bacteroidota bacterium]
MQNIGLYFIYNWYNNSFTNHVIQLEAGDSLYMFSDGYADQFGGEKGKKFMVKNLQKSILSTVHLYMAEQQYELLNIFKNWQGTNEQLDDVCLIGIRM